MVRVGPSVTEIPSVKKNAVSTFNELNNIDTLYLGTLVSQNDNSTIITHILSNTAIEATKNRCLVGELNSHFQVS